MAWQFKVKTVDVTEAEKKKIDELLLEVMGSSGKIEITDFLTSAALYAQELPRRLREVFYKFKLCQAEHALQVRIQGIDESLIGRTPIQHLREGQKEIGNRYDLIHLLFALLLGEPFGWSTIQNGYIINDVIPILEHRDLAASSGFASTFGLHTEDAFHPWAGDYLGLLCLRNLEQAATLFSGIDPYELSSNTLKVLRENRFIIGANIAQNVEAIKQPSPILYGSIDEPYFRINLNSTAVQKDDFEAEEALKEVVAMLLRNIYPVVFQAGDFWYIDNLRVAHGREQFQPQFSGQDRWLRRLYISSAFRYTSGMREQPHKRVLDPSQKQWSIYL